MKNYKTLLAEAESSRTIVLAFARMTPPTAGHGLVIQTILREAKKHNAKHIVYLSATQDIKKNPLSVDQKVYWARKSFPGVNIVGADSKIRTFIEAVKAQDGKYSHLVVVAGSDRVTEYKTLLEKYNGRDYTFDKIEVVSAGERDPDADGAVGMSATKLRSAAVANDFALFRRGVSSKLSDDDVRKMMNDVRAGMGITRTVDESLSITKARDSFYRGLNFLVGQIVVEGDIKYEIIDRGSNYVTVVNESGEISKKFVDKLNVVDESMEYSNSLYKGFVPSAKFCQVPGLLDATELAAQENIADSFAMLRGLQLLDSYISNDTGNFDRICESFRNANVIDYFTPILESMTDKPIAKAGDKLKVAKIIADTLGADASSSNADQMVNMALRGIKNKPIGKTMLPILQKMVNLAVEVGIKIDKTSIPPGITLGINETEAEGMPRAPRSDDKGAKLKLVNKQDVKVDKVKKPYVQDGINIPVIGEQAAPTDPDEFKVNVDALGFDQLRKSLLKFMSLKHGDEHPPHPHSHKPGHSLDSNDVLRRMKIRKLRDAAS